MLARIAAESGNRPGGPAKLLDIMLDLVRGEGSTEGREVAFRLPLGVDCYDEIKARVDETQKVLEERKDVI